MTHGDAGQRPFRFGHQLRAEFSGADDVSSIIEEAQAAEAAGFDIVTIPDHIGPTMASPMMVLAALAQVTSTVRLGTFVLNNEMRNPVQLAWESVALDQLSNGRFELGIGAGHTPYEFAATGLAFDPAGTRKERLAEAVDVMRALFDGETVTHAGQHYSFTEASIGAPAQERLPIMVAGNGDALLTHAAAIADIIGLNGLGRTQKDGHRHSVKFGSEWLEYQVETVRNAAGGRTGGGPELNALVQRVDVTDDRERAAAEVVDAVDGVTVEQVLTTPYLALGTHDEIADHFRAMRDKWGISYFVSRDVEGIAPVIERLRAS